MANLTVFQGRRCTRVRRAVVNGTAASSPTPKAASNTSKTTGTEVAATPPAVKVSSPITTPSVSSSGKSVFAPTTNFPRQSGEQIATVIIPDIVSLGGDQSPAPPNVTPPPKPPQVTNTPPPAPVAPPPANPPPANPPPANPPPAPQTTAVPQVRFFSFSSLH
jgi:hypothetical protein